MTYLSRTKTPEPRLESSRPEKPYGQWDQGELAERMAALARQEARNRGETPGNLPRAVEKIVGPPRPPAEVTETKVLLALRLHGASTMRGIMRATALSASVADRARVNLIEKGLAQVAGRSNGVPTYALTEAGRQRLGTPNR